MTFEQAKQLATLIGGTAVESLPGFGVPGVELTRKDGVLIRLHEHGGAAYRGDMRLYSHEWRTWHGSSTWARPVACLLDGLAIPGEVYEVWIDRADGASIHLRAKEAWTR